jgi:ABC-type transporter Mla subunit MlaD
LFFTFVGLSAALLQVAGDGHHGALSPDKLRGAVENILGISSVKFITSLAGILAYIGWSLVARFQADAQDRAVGHLVAEIRRLSTYVSPEKVLLQQLKTQQAQHAQFQSFGTDLAVAIGRQIENALQSRLDRLPDAVATSVGIKVSDALTPVRDELLTIGRKIGETGGQIANGAGDVFSQVWKTSMETPIAAFGEQMKTIVGTLEGLPNTVRQLEAGLGGQIGGATKELTDTMAALGTIFRTQQEAMINAVTGFNDRVADIPKIFAAASQNSVSVVSKAVEDSLGKISGITARAGQATAEQLSGEVAKIAASLAASAEALKVASDASSTNIRQAGHALDEGVYNSIKSVQEASLKSSAEFTGQVSSLSEIVKELCDRLSQSTVVLEAQQARLNRAGDLVSTASTHLSNAALSVERAAAPLPSALGAMQTAADRVAAASGQLQETSASEKQAAEMLNDSVGAARTAFDEQASRFGELQERVRETVGDLVKGVSRLANEISTCIETYDSAIAKSIGGLENAILDIADVVELRPRDDRRVAIG